MAINYPASLDNFTNPTADDSLNSDTVPHADQHANINDAVEALQAKVGADSSAVTSSHDYKIADHASRLTTLEGQGTYIDYSASQGFVSLTPGNGTVESYYARIGDLVHFHGRVLWGSTTSLSGNWRVNLPVPVRPLPGSPFFGAVMGTGILSNLGTANHMAFFPNFGSFDISVMFINSATGTITDANATSPFTWTTGDRMSWNIVYRIA